MRPSKLDTIIAPNYTFLCCLLREETKGVSLAFVSKDRFFFVAEPWSCTTRYPGSLGFTLYNWFIPGSFNGRTVEFGSADLGSNPSPGAGYLPEENPCLRQASQRQTCPLRSFSEGGSNSKFKRNTDFRSAISEKRLKDEAGTFLSVR